MGIRFSTRLVFLIGNYAVKIPIDRRGWLQGINERELWNKYKSSNLVPLVWGLGGIVCQRRAQSLPEFKDDYAILLKQQIPELDIDNCDLYCPANWGKYNDSVVLIDYGIDENISKMY